ncbi:MAG: GHKL domain-containing protein [Lachnospiraceae bacterium]|nr:GHKL domain-containing protein [Lachnospiraceae bacterium]
MMWGKDYKKEYALWDEKYNQLLGERAELAYELEQLKSSVGKIVEQDTQVRELHENVRRLKHDMKNHMMVIASYLNGREYEKAKEYTSVILDKLNAVHSYIETGNSLLNHILNEKLNLARSRGIAVKAEIENISFAKMESLDFSALLSNVLDNAIEACAKEVKPQLQVQIASKRGYDTIFVKNSISQSVLEENPQLQTTKESSVGHGMGIAQIKAITEKYGGLCDFYEETGCFCVSVFIPI